MHKTINEQNLFTNPYKMLIVLNTNYVNEDCDQIIRLRKFSESNFEYFKSYI
jgi:hypothetical protein